MFRKKNTEVIVQIIILAAIACLLIYAMISRKINYYVHPRFFAGIWGSIVIIILFAISLIPKIGKARHNVDLRHYVIFVIPLVAALLFPASGVNGKNMTVVNYNASISKNNQKKVGEKIDENNVESTLKPEEYYQDTYADENDTTEYKEETDASDTFSETKETEDSNSVGEGNYYEKYAKYEKDGVMVINDDIFADWYADLYDHLDSFKGKKCKYLAQVYFMDDLKKNQFLAGRYFMVCCAADLVGSGIVCESDKISNLKKEEWITISGTINEYKYNGYMVPLLTDVTIKKAKAPKVEYIYYNGY